MNKKKYAIHLLSFCRQVVEKEDVEEKEQREENHVEEKNERVEEEEKNAKLIL